MRYKVLILIVMMALGTGINVVLAWACSSVGSNARPFRPLITPGSSRLLPSIEARSAWNIAFGESVFVTGFDEAGTLDPEVIRHTAIYGSMHFWIREERSSGFGWERLHLSDMLRPMPPSMTVFRAGWPMHSFQCEAITEPLGSPRVMTTRQQHGFVLHWPLRGGPGSHRIDLPYKPIPFGFAINTLLYALAVWMLFAFAIATRRHIRIRNGLCTKCGYDLRGGGHVQCPECGERQGRPNA